MPILYTVRQVKTPDYLQVLLLPSSFILFRNTYHNICINNKYVTNALLSFFKLASIGPYYFYYYPIVVSWVYTYVNARPTLSPILFCEEFYIALSVLRMFRVYFQPLMYCVEHTILKSISKDIPIMISSICIMFPKFCLLQFSTVR